MPEKKENKTENQELSEQYGKLLAHWSFPEYVKYERGALWYVVAVVAVVAMLIYGLVQVNFLFVLFLIILSLVVGSRLYGEPKEVQFRIFEDGINMGKVFYKWEGINNFRLVYKPPQVKRLYIDLQGTFWHDFSVPLEDQDPVEIRRILLNYLEEDLTKQEETLTDRLNRWFKI